MILWGEEVWIWDRNCNFSQKKKRSMLYQSSNSTLMGTNLFVFLRESPIWSVNQKAQIWAVTRKSSDYSYFIYALEWNKRNDNTTVRTYRKHRIMLSLIMTYFHLNQKDSWNLYSYCTASSHIPGFTAQRDRRQPFIEKFNLQTFENIPPISTHSQPRSPKVY